MEDDFRPLNTLVNIADNAIEITIIDYRPGHMIKERFPCVDHLLYSRPEDLQDTVKLDQFKALVIMTHNMEYDQRYLKQLVDTNIPFIGLLGPVHRKIKLLQSLGADSAKLLLNQFSHQVLTIPLPEAELYIDCIEDFDFLKTHYPIDAIDL